MLIYITKKSVSCFINEGGMKQLILLIYTELSCKLRPGRDADHSSPSSAEIKNE
jgi:hypothetical protein